VKKWDGCCYGGSEETWQRGGIICCEREMQRLVSEREEGVMGFLRVMATYIWRCMRGMWRRGENVEAD